MPSRMNKNRPEFLENRHCPKTSKTFKNHAYKTWILKIIFKKKGLRNKGGETTQMLAPKDQNSLDRTSHFLLTEKDDWGNLGWDKVPSQKGPSAPNPSPGNWARRNTPLPWWNFQGKNPCRTMEEQGKKQQDLLMPSPSNDIWKVSSEKTQLSRR